MTCVLRSIFPEAGSFATSGPLCQRRYGSPAGSQPEALFGEANQVLQGMTSSAIRQLSARRSGPLRGDVGVPGDKSISHRALILGALAAGETSISGLLEAEDVLHTAEIIRQF